MVGLGLRRGDHSWLLSRNQKLLRAAAANQPERVLAVLAKKKNIFKKAADVNASDAAGRTTLHYSVLNKNEGLFQNLLEEHKADSSVVDKEGDSVMLLVAKHGTYREAVLLAKDPSCSLNTRGKDGLCAWHVAAAQGKVDVLHGLFCTRRPPGAVDHLDVNVTSTEGQTALHLAAKERKTDSIRYLVTKAKVDAEIRDQSGQTALDVADPMIGRFIRDLIDEMEHLAQEDKERAEQIARDLKYVTKVTAEERASQIAFAEYLQAAADAVAARNWKKAVDEIEAERRDRIQQFERENLESQVEEARARKQSLQKAIQLYDEELERIVAENEDYEIQSRRNRSSSCVLADILTDKELKAIRDSDFEWNEYELGVRRANAVLSRSLQEHERFRQIYGIVAAEAASVADRKIMVRVADEAFEQERWRQIFWRISSDIAAFVESRTESRALALLEDGNKLYVRKRRVSWAPLMNIVHEIKLRFPELHDEREELQDPVNVYDRFEAAESEGDEEGELPWQVTEEEVVDDSDPSYVRRLIRHWSLDGGITSKHVFPIDDEMHHINASGVRNN